MDDRARIEAILVHPEAVRRPSLARRLALHSSLGVNEAVDMLRAAAVEAEPSGAGRPRGFGPGAGGAAGPVRFMGFGEAVGRAFSRYAVFSGRARRAEYWWWVVFTLLAGTIMHIGDVILFPDHPPESAPFSLAFALVTFLPSLAVLVRRLHDVGRSGWWVGAFVLFLVPGLLVALSVSAAASLAGPDAQDGGTVATLLGAGVLLILGWTALLFIWCLMRSRPGANRYGPSPLEVDA